MPLTASGWYSEVPSCSRCGGRLISEAEWCRCGGRAAAYSEPQIGQAIAQSRAVDDGWTGEDGDLLETELRRHPVTWQEAMSQLRRKYRADY